MKRSSCRERLLKKTEYIESKFVSERINQFTLQFDRSLSNFTDLSRKLQKKASLAQIRERTLIYLLHNLLTMDFLSFAMKISVVVIDTKL